MDRAEQQTVSGGGRIQYASQVTKSVSPLDEALAGFDKQVAALNAAIEQLPDRLQHVLAPGIKINEMGHPDDELQSAPLVEALRQKRANIYTLTVKIEDLLARLVL